MGTPVTPTRLVVKVLSGVVALLTSSVGAAGAVATVAAVAATRPGTDHWEGPSSELLNASPTCGLYALIACGRSLRPDLPVGALLNADFVSRPGGSTPDDLAKAARAAGLRTVQASRLAIDDLATIDPPLLLHVRAAPWTRQYDHWVAVLGRAEGGLTVYDPLQPEPQTWRLADLLGRWGGTALLVRRPGEGHPYLEVAGVPSNVVFVAVVLGAGCLLWAGTRARSLPKLVTLQFGALTWATAVVVVFTTQPASHRDDVFEAVDRYFTASLLNTVARDQVAADVRSGAAVLVDAREQPDYAKSRIAGAGSLCLSRVQSMGLGQLRSLQFARPVVVYCSDDKCDAARLVAQALVAAGHRDVSVLSGGLHEWRSAGFPVDAEAAR
jgi:rhodanese-related sulfurtransferase